MTLTRNNQDWKCKCSMSALKIKNYSELCVSRVSWMTRMLGCTSLSPLAAGMSQWCQCQHRSLSAQSWRWNNTFLGNCTGTCGFHAWNDIEPISYCAAAFRDKWMQWWVFVGCRTCTVCLAVWIKPFFLSVFCTAWDTCGLMEKAGSPVSHNVRKTKSSTTGGT